MVAASVMGQLRQTLSLLLSEGAPPADALARVNEFLTTSPIHHIATVLVVVVDPGTGCLRLASAGHLAPVAVGAQGARNMAVRPGPPLGVHDARFEEITADLSDETLVLFTDGLTERRHRHPDAGLHLLLRTLEASSDLDPGRLIDYALAQLLTDGTGADDVVMLAARQTRGR
jgi:serine/threonine-protein kinase RsbW